jgi:hypothetical protein
MRGRELPPDGEVAHQAGAEVAERLHVAVGSVQLPVSMPEVDIRRDECSTLVKQTRYLIELLLLELTDVFEDSLRDDDVERLVLEPDRCL